MESEGFKFTFFEKKDCGRERQSRAGKRYPSQPRPVLAHLQKPCTDFRIHRQSTVRRQFSALKRRDSSRDRIEAEPDRSKSQLKSSIKISRKSPLINCNFLKLLPVLHHYKRTKILQDLSNSIKTPSANTISKKPLTTLNN